MRKWYKYYIDLNTSGKIFVGIGRDFAYFEKDIGGYQSDEAYQNKNSLFQKYFFGYHLGRLEYYDRFLRKNLKNDQSILSIASGRCVNELLLINDGYKIICSDLKTPDGNKQIKILFPQFEFIEHDILNGPTKKKFDAIICLSLIYLFDEKDLLKFFKNISDSLVTGGSLLLDSAGSSDNVLSYLIHDIILKYETMGIRLARFLLARKLPAFVTKHHGYRRTDSEIIDSAEKFALKLAYKENYAFLTEFRRSYFLNRFVKPNSSIEKIFSIIGRSIPYIRMFNFKKIT